MPGGNRKQRQELGVEELPPRETKTPTQVHRDVQQNVQEMKQMESVARRTAEESTQRTARMKAMTAEANEVGIKTAEKLEQQSRQLEKIDNELEEVHDILDKGERTVNKMTKRFFARSSRKKDKATKAQQTQQQEDKDRGVTSLDFPDDTNETNRRELLGPMTTAQEKTKEIAKRRNRPARTGANKELMEELDTAEDQQDADLDEMSKMLGNMKTVANAIDSELKYQEQMISKVHTGAEGATARMDATNKKLKSMIK